MTARDTFLDVVRNGGAPICSPQIGGGAGFDTRLAGKEWISRTTLEDTIAAAERFDIVPLFNIGLCDFGELNPDLAWRDVRRDRQDDRIVTESVLETPVGPLTRTVSEQKREGLFHTAYPVRSSDDLPALEWVIDAALDSDFTAATRGVDQAVALIAGRGALSVQWPVQPYELLCYPDTVDTVLLANDCPDRFAAMMDKIVRLDEKLFDAVAAGGADFIFLGAPGSEMISPDYYERFIIPYSRQVTAMAREADLMVYSHICALIEPFLTKGFYNRMGIDLFETLSPPPVGNVASLADALTRLDPSICTRGNLGLDILLNESPERVRRETFEILGQSAGRKHIVAASDYLFYGVPEENVHAMAEAVRDYR